ncbi:uncharacterized protein [Amphiura filiformis]|uniref:uncharacterized protein n=1 Tax=Amphiura filiformis TaxID=82378 RepID=UPI003B2259DB
MFIAANSHDGVTSAGSAVGILHMTRNDEEILRGFMYAAGSCGNDGDADYTVRSGLQSIVQDIFNKLFAKQTDGRWKKVPYKSIDDGRVIVTTEGLPLGVQLKKPSSYSLKILKDIIRCQEDVKFTKVETQEIVNGDLDRPSSTRSMSPALSSSSSLAPASQFSTGSPELLAPFPTSSTPPSLPAPISAANAGDRVLLESGNSSTVSADYGGLVEDGNSSMGRQRDTSGGADGGGQECTDLFNRILKGQVSVDISKLNFVNCKGLADDQSRKRGKSEKKGKRGKKTKKSSSK